MDGTDTNIGSSYDFADERLTKAGWSRNPGNNDGGKGIHNPAFVFSFMDASIDAVGELLPE